MDRAAAAEVCTDGQERPGSYSGGRTSTPDRTGLGWGAGPEFMHGNRLEKSAFPVEGRSPLWYNNTNGYADMERKGGNATFD